MPRMRKFKIIIENGKVKNTNRFVVLGDVDTDLVHIIVAIFDLQGFTNFFHSIGLSKPLIIKSFINAFLSWLDYSLTSRGIKPPSFSKFTGDGVILIWEKKSLDISSEEILEMMDRCWQMTRDYSEFLKIFEKESKRRWNIEKYPEGLKVGISTGYALKYTHEGKITDYISESINIASRLVKYCPKIRFLAHADLHIGSEPGQRQYTRKSVKLKGIEEKIFVFIDTYDFRDLRDKSIFLED